MNRSQKNILISLEERHVKCILKKEKKVELRNRRMNLSAGDRIWVYSKRPHGCIVMTAIVKTVDKDSPKSLWRKHQQVCGITKQEFFAYFCDVEVGYAISLYKIKTFTAPVSLEKIRKKYKGFHPPQFSKYLDGVPLLSFLEKCLASA